MRAVGSPIPDPAHLLASLCDRSRGEALPFVAAAVGTHPINWRPLSAGARTARPWRAPDDAYAIGMLCGGTTQTGADVLVAFVVDRRDRRRAVIFCDGNIIDTAEATGRLVDDCRDALGLTRAA